MIRRILYITAVQIMVYAVGFPMLISYELSAARLNSIYANSATSSLSPDQKTGLFPSARSAR